VRIPRNLSLLEEVFPTAKRDDVVVWFFKFLLLGRKNSVAVFAAAELLGVFGSVLGWFGSGQHDVEAEAVYSADALGHL
jgi:hypothetical protein